MPELPEIETIKNGIICLEGHKIINVIVRVKKLRQEIPIDIIDNLINKKIVNIKRRAKYLIFELSNGYLVVHLGMSGRISITNKNVDLKKHDHLDIIFDNGIILRYNDPRRFGLIDYTNSLETLNYINRLSIEPLTKDFDGEFLFNKIKNSNRSIKQLIMENEVVVGVGNIYANESLFLSKIIPTRCGNQVTLSECIILVKNIKAVLLDAISKGGSTLKDYQHADGSMGYFQNSHLVYAKDGHKCVTCGTIIEKIYLGQRNSFYCPKCQK